MSRKPFTLTLYPPPGEPDPDCTNCDGTGCMGCVFREYDHDCRDDCPECCGENVPPDKRFSDAELAAEYWLAEWSPSVSRRRVRIIRRFAVTDHEVFDAH